MTRNGPEQSQRSPGGVGRGQFSLEISDDRCFFPENAALGPVADRSSLLARAERRVILGYEGAADITLFLVDGAVAALVCGKRLRAQWMEELSGPLL